MTILAGAICIDPTQSLPEKVADQLPKLLSRNTKDVPTVFRGSSYILAKIDIGAFGVLGEYIKKNGAISILAGELIIEDSENRADEHRFLSDAAPDFKERLCHCNGTFAWAYFDPEVHCLTLASDKLAVRPIYFTQVDGLFLFATALRIIENLEGITKQIDICGLAEVAAFGFPLDNHTAYNNVKTIRSGEIIIVDCLGIHSSFYWRWDQVRIDDKNDVDSLAVYLYEQFIDAIQQRLRKNRATVTFLSGGLDSRCIAAALTECTETIHSINFAPTDTQDLVFGRAIAKQLGTLHFEYSLSNESNKASIAHAAWLRQVDQDQCPERPFILWSGDGGSVGVGHVYLSQTSIDCARTGEWQRAANLISGGLLSRHLFKSGVRDLILEAPLKSAVEELKKFENVEPGRACYLYLMFNDQRRHLANHFENIDLQRIELFLPFFDASFVEAIVAQPVDVFLGHHFYNRWLQEFPGAISEVPWQSYPGHESCPLPIPDTLRYQWQNYYNESDEKKIRQQAVEAARMILRDNHFPKHLLNKSVLRVASWLVALGWGDYQYIINTANIFTSSWKQCTK